MKLDKEMAMTRSRETGLRRIMMTILEAMMTSSNYKPSMWSESASSSQLFSQVSMPPLNWATSAGSLLPFDSVRVER